MTIPFAMLGELTAFLAGDFEPPGVTLAGRPLQLRLAAPGIFTALAEAVPITFAGAAGLAFLAGDGLGLPLVAAGLDRLAFAAPFVISSGSPEGSGDELDDPISPESLFRFTPC